MKRKTNKHLLPAFLLCALFAGCGRQPYILPVKDGKEISKGAHVFWDAGGAGAAKAVGSVTDVTESGDSKRPVLIKFDLKDEYRQSIRENVAGAVMSDPTIAQSAFVLLLGGTGEGKESLKPGVAIKEVRPATASAADYATSFFNWLRNARIEELKAIGGILLVLFILLKIVKKILKAIVMLAILGAIAYCFLSVRGGWEEQKEQLRQGISSTFEQATDWTARHADQLRAELAEQIDANH
jgi:hypothetical protein